MAINQSINQSIIFIQKGGYKTGNFSSNFSNPVWEGGSSLLGGNSDE